MLFGSIFGDTVFGNPILLTGFPPLSWHIQCAPTVGVEEEDDVDDPAFIQMVENLWVVQNINVVDPEIIEAANSIWVIQDINKVDIEIIEVTAGDWVVQDVNNNGRLVREC